MITLMLALMPTASAVDWGDPKPYAFPRLSGGYTVVNGQGYGQVSGGGDVGMTIRALDKPHWLSMSRVSGLLTYGINSGSVGGDLRVGSFIGPDGKLVQLMTGPDIWYNGYGQPLAVDYFLPWSPGVDLRNTALLKLADEFKLLGEITPGWAFSKPRQSAASELVLFHELEMGAYAFLNLKSLSLTLGYTRTINSLGNIDGIVIAFGI